LSLSGKTILVTGGAGFIGSHLIERLLEEGSKVTAYDNFDDFYPGKEDNVRPLLQKKNFRVIRDDILNADSLSSAMKGKDVVFHIAGQAGIRYCNENPLKANEVNVRGTLNVLELAKKNNVRKIVYASSSSVYGDTVRLPIDEDHPTNPNSPYGVSKLAGEQYCRVFARVYGTNVVSLRYFSVYGPRGRPDQAIYAFAQRFAQGKPPVIYGDGSQTRDFTFISDVVEATKLAGEAELSPGEVMNVGFGRRISISDLVVKIARAMKLEDLKPEYRERSKGDFQDTEADNARARKLLAWKPEVELDAGLKLFLNWFKANSRTRTS
jgi:UDP-glucose 4-epimerase